MERQEFCKMLKEERLKAGIGFSELAWKFGPSGHSYTWRIEMAQMNVYFDNIIKYCNHINVTLTVSDVNGSVDILNTDNTSNAMFKILEHSKITAYKLAKIIGVGHQTLGFYKSGKRIPTIDTMLKIFDALGYTISLTKNR